jgi:hypothetical protein
MSFGLNHKKSILIDSSDIVFEQWSYFFIFSSAQFTRNLLPCSSVQKWVSSFLENTLHNHVNVSYCYFQLIINISSYVWSRGSLL